ncbi:MAG: hypothetical protein ACE5I1_21855 [bacterium]
MNPIVKNILAVVAGFIGGSIVNMGLVMAGSTVIPPPAGVNVMDAESIKASMHLYKAHHFITPFVAHALGTLVGAYLAGRIGATHKMKLALGIGALFFIGGIWAASMIPAPTWFVVLDLVGAYIPMGWLGGKLADK